MPSFPMLLTSTIKATAIALRKHPRLNGTVVAQEIHLLPDIHIGVAPNAEWRHTAGQVPAPDDDMSTGRGVALRGPPRKPRVTVGRKAAAMPSETASSRAQAAKLFRLTRENVS